MARRSIIGEIQRQAKLAQRAKQQAIRQEEIHQRQAEQRRKAAERSAEADRKRSERELKAVHVAEMEAEVTRQNGELGELYQSIDGLLASALEVDPFVELSELRLVVEHPTFDRSDLETPIPEPDPIPDPPEPVFTPSKLPLGRKKKLASHAEAHDNWLKQVESLPERRRVAAEEHARAEAERVAELDKERSRYDRECAAREAEVAEHNTALDTLIANLGYGTVDAVEEYILIVLGRSSYPEVFEVNHVDCTFDPTTAELQLRALVPGPATVPCIKAYKYTKSTDEITTVALSQKACRDRYADAVHHVALRTLHEVFRADRRGVIKTISLEVGSETTDPATGNNAYIPFVAVAARRDVFLEFDLSSVVPVATLSHLGAAMSKNPHALVAADASGVRRS